MSLLRKLHLVKSLLTAALAAPLLMSCYNYDHEEVPVVAEGNKYINMTIAISSGGYPSTRAVPAGGENGDGREAGFYRENDVSGVTLFFYRATDGINADASTAIDYTVYYPVTPITEKRDDPHTSEEDIDDSTRPGMTADEYVFTTGNRLLEPGKINPNDTYHIIAVLNADLSKSGLATLGAMRDYKFDALYSGGLTGDVQSCTNFIMTSEQDFTMTLASLTPTKIAGDDYYTLTDPLRVERLAARIDFETEYGTGKACVGYNNTLASGNRGYEYNVGTWDGSAWSSSDKFVVTAITPFNVNTMTSTNGGEYLIKRLTDDFGTSGTTMYLVDESDAPATDKYCYVLDPDTKAKETATVLGNFVNTLKGTTWLNDDLTTSFSGLAASKYPFQTVEALYAKLHEEGGSDTYSGGLKLISSSVNTGDIVIIGYPMENTLGPNAKLYDYATGLAIEGDYYSGGLSVTPEHIIYYGFLRHQGESSDTYPAYPMITDVTTLKDLTCNPSFPMNFSIVRNNIYRVSIESITPKGPTGPKIMIKIEEEKWRHVDNPKIYI